MSLPVAVPEISCSLFARGISTAATRSARFICHRQRSHRFPIPPHPQNEQNYFNMAAFGCQHAPLPTARCFWRFGKKCNKISIAFVQFFLTFHLRLRKIDSVWCTLHQYWVSQRFMITGVLPGFGFCTPRFQFINPPFWPVLCLISHGVHAPTPSTPIL